MTAAALREPDRIFDAVAAECEIDPTLVLARLNDEINRPYESPRTKEVQ